MRLTTLITTACLALVCNLSYALQSPVEMLRNTSESVLAELKQHKLELKADKAVIYNIVQRHLLPNTDVRGMSRSVLGRKVWKGASIEQQKRFSHEFTRLVVRTYSGALADYTDETMRFQALKKDYNTARRLKVYSTIVRSKGPDIPLTYRVINKKKQWKVYDMSVEGISLLQSFRNQFKQELARGNLDMLNDKLHKLNTRTRS